MNRWAIAVCALILLPACKPASRQAERLPGATAEWVPPEPVVPWAPPRAASRR